MIDAHQHFWEIARGDYGWLSADSGVLYQDFQPEHLRPLLDACQINGTVLVQAAPTEAESRYLLGIAEQVDWVKGVVGWVALDNPDVENLLEAINHPLLKGIRPMLQDIEDPFWINDAVPDFAFRKLIELDLVFEALVKPPQWQPLLCRLLRHPELRVVMDHGAKPENVKHQQKEWQAWLRKMAAETRAVCKLSGLWTEAGEALSLEQIRPWLDSLFEAFGPERIIWGSDWPVITATGEYKNWFLLCQQYCEQFSLESRQAIFGNTAISTYRL